MAGKKQYTEAQRAKFKEERKAKLDAFTQSLAGKIVDLINTGSTEEWRKPWKDQPLAGMPVNPVSGHRFSGGNFLSLAMYMMDTGTADPRFCTYKQAKKLGEGVHVQKGAEGIVVLRPVIVKTQDDQNEERILDGKSGDDSEDEQKIVFFRPAKVFHASQIENMPALESDDELSPRDWTDHAMIERLVAASGVSVTHGFNQAAYFPARDKVRMPEKDAFTTQAEYYAVQFHEWFHATGHRSREDRGFGETAKFSGIQNYAMEELRAETFSALASAMFGLPYKITTGADYLKHWNSKLQSDPKDVLAAAVQASKVLETVVSFAQDEQPKASWFPDKSTWPAKQDQEDEDEELLFGINAQETQEAFGDEEEDLFSELDDMDFSPSL